MATNLLTEYGATKVTVDANNPNGTFKNRTNDVLKDGTPLDQAWTRDVWGFLSHLLKQTGISPNGSEENEANSQYFEALQATIVATSPVYNWVLNGDHRVNQLGFSGSASWVGGQYQTVDQWQNIEKGGAGVTGTVSLSSSQPATLSGGNALKFTSTGTLSAYAYFLQKIEDYAVFIDRNTAASVWVRSNSPNARFFITDGVSESVSNAHTGGGGWELLKVSHSINSGASLLRFGVGLCDGSAGDVSISTGDEVEFTGAVLNYGGGFSPFIPRNYEDELRKCQRYFYRAGSSSFGNIPIANLSARSTSQMTGVLRFPVPMRTFPTMAASGGGDFNIVYQNTLTQSTLVDIDGARNSPEAAIVRANDLTTSPFTIGEGGYLYTRVSGAYLDFNARL